MHPSVVVAAAAVCHFCPRYTNRKEVKVYMCMVCTAYNTTN